MWLEKPVFKATNMKGVAPYFVNHTSPTNPILTVVILNELN